MALVVADRVQDVTTTTGTGTIMLANTPPSGFQNFSVIGDGNTTYYTITNGGAWEVGIGTYSASGPALARTTVLSSSNGGAPVYLTGASSVFVTLPAEASQQVFVQPTQPAHIGPWIWVKIDANNNAVAMYAST